MEVVWFLKVFVFKGLVSGSIIGRDVDFIEYGFLEGFYDMRV